jgi:hypothetical protein
MDIPVCMGDNGTSSLPDKPEEGNRGTVSVQSHYDYAQNDYAQKANHYQRACSRGD